MEMRVFDAQSIYKNYLISLPETTNLDFPLSILTAYPTMTLKLLMILFLFCTSKSDATRLSF